MKFLMWILDGFYADIVVDNCAICRNHIMDLCKCFSTCFFFGSISDEFMK